MADQRNYKPVVSAPTGAGPNFVFRLTIVVLDGQLFTWNQLMQAFTNHSRS